MAPVKPVALTVAPKGIFCPHCFSQKLRVLHTRPLTNGRTRRCRLCKDCGKRSYSVETANAISR